MADVPLVTIVNGLPTAGTGTVMTISQIVAALPAALGAGGGLKIDGSGTAVPISGTLTGVTTVSTVTNLSQMGGVAISLNTGVRDTGTQRVTIATNDIVPVSQSGTWTVTAGAVAQGSTTSGQTGSLIQGAVTTSAPTYTTAQTSPLSLDTTGALRVNVTAGGAGGGVVTQATGTNLHMVVDSGTVTTVSAVTAITNALPAGTNNIGDVDVLTVPTDPFGANADAASATGSISAKLRGVSTALGVTALDLGVGTGGSRSLRVAVDSSQIPTAGQAISTASVPTVQCGFPYETVAASQTAQAIGATGAAGDYLSHVVVSPATAGCGVVTILDNATTVIAFPGGGTTALPSLAPFVIPVGMLSTSGAWKITTGANVSCVAVGRFT